MQSARFAVRVSPGDVGAARIFEISATDPVAGTTMAHEYRLPAIEHVAYLDLFASIARDFGSRTPLNRQSAPPPAFQAALRPLITHALSPDIRYGYGDPAALRVSDTDGVGEPTYYAVVTSNDAPHAFPILRSPDLERWDVAGFVFPDGQQPHWAARGELVGEYWAPEIHRVGGEFRVYFAARPRDGHGMWIGVATSPHPHGPFVTPDEPLIRGNVIDPHLLVDASGDALLFWKEDTNDVWPRLLNELLFEHEELAPLLFPRAEDLTTVHLQRAMWPWIRTLEPMERFFAQQVLIEATTSDFAAFRQRLSTVLAAEGPTLDPIARARAAGVREALVTPVYAQRLAPSGTALAGERTVVLENDLAWEAHLIEGIWVSRHDDRYYLFYSGNDFSTADYGIGVAVATSPLGPFQKMPEPLLRSTAEWSGPGHPSVVTGPDGEPWLVLHAFRPGHAGYKQFRAMLAARIEFAADRVALRPDAVR